MHVADFMQKYEYLQQTWGDCLHFYPEIARHHLYGFFAMVHQFLNHFEICIREFKTHRVFFGPWGEGYAPMETAFFLDGGFDTPQCRHLYLCRFPNRSDLFAERLLTQYIFHCLCRRCLCIGYAKLLSRYFIWALV